MESIYFELIAYDGNRTLGQYLEAVTESKSVSQATSFLAENLMDISHKYGQNTTYKKIQINCQIQKIHV